MIEGDSVTDIMLDNDITTATTLWISGRRSIQILKVATKQQKFKEYAHPV